MIKREFYLNQIIPNMHNGEIKVITGIRRCSESVLLFELFRDHLLEHDTREDQSITIELDQRKYYKFRNPITLDDLEGFSSELKEARHSLMGM